MPKKQNNKTKKQEDIIAELIDRVEDLTEIVKDIKSPRKTKIVRDGLIRGIAWGIGKIIGLLIVAGILYLILANANFIPGLGKWIAEIIKVVQLNI